MARKHKRKTAVVMLRMEPQVKAAAETAAQQEHRSLTNFIEILIIKHCRAQEIRIETASSSGE